MKRILVVKLSSLGDVIASTSSIDALSNIPNVQVDHLVMKHCKIITEHSQKLNSQLVLDQYPSGSIIKDIANITLLYFRIVFNRYDYAFIFHRSPLFLLLLRFALVKKIYCFSNRMDLLSNGVVEYTVNRNRTLLEHDLIRLSGLTDSFPDSLSFTYPQKGLGDFILPESYITCNPGGGNLHSSATNRLWPVESYAELIKKLPYPVVLLGSGSDDFQRSVSIATKSCSNNVINLVGRTSFHQTASIIENSLLYIGNDSSLSFLSAALNVRGVIIFGPTQADAALPYGNTHTAVKSNVDCSPCYNPFDGVGGVMYKCSNNICMKEISVEEVYINIINSISDNHEN